MKIELMQILYDEISLETRYDKECSIPSQRGGFELYLRMIGMEW